MKNRKDNFDMRTLDYDLILTIPTYRPMSILDSVTRYVSNFKEFGHLVPIIIFDDSQIDSSDIFNGANGIDNPAGVFYVGPEEKYKFVKELRKHIRISPNTLEGILKPSYGGNRNYTALFSLGRFFITADDDMYPYALLEDCHGLKDLEVCKGRYVNRNAQYRIENQDIVGAFSEVLGKEVGKLKNFLIGESIEDSVRHPKYNISSDNIEESVLSLTHGSPSLDAVVKMAQTFRAGSSDVDTKDYAKDFLEDPELVSQNDMKKMFVISDFRKCITDLNWIMDNGVAAFDNTIGMPPFIPTRLRCEDFAFGLWSQNKKIACAHVNAVQTHRRSPYNRESIPSDFHNEELANFLKLQLPDLAVRINDINIDFEGEVYFSERDAQLMIERAKRFYDEGICKANFHEKPGRGLFLTFANSMYHHFNGFNLKSFYNTTEKRLIQEYKLLKKTNELWPELINVAGKIDKPIKLIR